MIASRMGNFSAFVRDCLNQYEDHYTEVKEHTHQEGARIGGLCVGVARPNCRACYPHGAPPREAWLAYRADPEGVGQSWLQAQAIAANDHEWHLVAENVAYSAPRPQVEQPKSLLDRLLRR
jgi:hypothetical protein